MVYIRKFALEGVEMILLNTLQGHFGEVRCVKWNHLKEKWVTGSEDGTIRIWVSIGLNNNSSLKRKNEFVSKNFFFISKLQMVLSVRTRYE